MIKNKLINTILLFAVLSGNVWADSKAIYDSKTKTLSLEGVLVPFIDEFTGKETDNKGIFDAQLEEKTKLVFELIPWSINFKNTFDGKNTSGYILYDHKTRSVKIPCFEVTTIAKFGDGIEGDVIYYKNVNMKQRHINYPIFHVEDMTKADSCESSVIPEPQKPPKKPTLTTTPTTTTKDSVEVEINGKVGTTVFVNGVDSGKTIDSTGKVKVVLDTSGDAGDKSFSISLKDDKGNESEVLSFSITKKQAITSKAQLKGNLSNANVKIYQVEDNGDKTLLFNEQTNSNGEFDAHEDELDDDKFYIYEVSGGVDYFNSINNKGTIRAANKGSWIKKQGLRVSLASEIAYIYLAKDLKYDFNASKVENRLDEVAKVIFKVDISGDGKVTATDLLSFNYQRNFGAINSSRFSDFKIEEIVSNIYKNDLRSSYTDDITTPIISNYNAGYILGITLSSDKTKAFIANTSGLEIIDITNVMNFVKIGSYNTNGNAHEIVLSKDETKAYIADDTNGLVILDITEPTNPVKIGHYDTNGNATGIALSKDETKAYIADYENGLVILDITEATNPVKIGHYNTNGKTRKIAFSKDYTTAYIVDTHKGLLIVDIAAPTNIVKISNYNTDGYAIKIAFSKDDTKAFTASEMNKFFIIVDITDLTNPTKIAETTTKGVEGVTLSKDETKAFLASYDGLIVLDITDFKNLKKVDQFHIGHASQVSLLSDETKIVVGLGSNLAIIDLELFNPISNNSSAQ